MGKAKVKIEFHIESVKNWKEREILQLKIEETKDIIQNNFINVCKREDIKVEFKFLKQ